MDDLARIENIYGSVAEYNRCMWEEANRYEPTEEEIAESERQYAEYCAKVKKLDGEPSEWIRNLVDNWEKRKPNRDDIYGGYEWARRRTLHIMSELDSHYKVHVDEEHNTFYGVPEGKFAISVEYHLYGEIHYKMVGNLSYEQFKEIYCDLWYAGLWPTMKYGKRIIGNCSLGSLRLHDLKELEEHK